MRALLPILVTAILMGGCATPTAQIQTNFSESLNEPYLKAGDASVKGQAFLRQRGGDVVRCSGTPVYLVPATPFFEEAISLTKEGKNPQYAGNLPPRFNSIVHTTECDADGNFDFTNLPGGDYFVTTQVTWQVDAYTTEGGELIQRVSLAEGETADIILDGNDLAP